MKKTLIIEGEPFSFDAEEITYQSNFAITEEDARALLIKANQLFGEIGLDFYLAFGTLLGAIREHGLIAGDEDVDVFVTNEQCLYANIPYLYANGLKIVRIIPGVLYSFRINDRAYIDVYILRPLRHSPWSIYCYSLNNFVTPKRYFRAYEDIEFLGIPCKCPQRPERLLVLWYGKNWQKPVRGHKFHYEVESHWYWTHRIWPTLLKIIGWPHWRHLVSKNYKTREQSLRAWEKWLLQLG